ncbi:iron-containing alcohol dehydrogenase [Maridesulfovibrio salexigens]|uniref:Iron-containing alcohol dehydrogenase n=1 Tax=Maridesulfovibrio salexigens (strain ATCC 14822 / DSM 2638 / NCIMB 8403 / VKM B-1763) TaxID=526222 RepID=C6C211_MARSD|nr:iron-containing alcohol dehydrogenase [Maridesulfovibrio salexigens]ACS81212.1 iron-containing alcohol dehydrogenase [Maridesulfovibrio salexigens DSM 2638]
MNFQFSTAPKIVFGPDTARSIPEHAATKGNNACLVTGKSPQRIQWLIDGLQEKGLSLHIVSIAGEPDTELIAGHAAEARAKNCDIVVAVGGGSVLDAGKAIAALIPNKRDVFDYLEVVGKGLPLTEKPLPLIAAPTTSGTGSEVTTNAVLLCAKQKVKVSLRSADMIPDIAVVDPLLTISAPPSVTAATGLDALTQLMESFVSRHAAPLTNALCREGLKHGAHSMLPAYKNGQDIEARTGMALASLFSGITLANAKLGAVHGFAAPLGGEFKAPHGAVCAALLPYVMEMNIRALKECDPQNPALPAYTEIAQILTGNNEAQAADGIEWVKTICAEMKIPGLGEIGVQEKDFKSLAAKAARASSMKGNPIELTENELLEILANAL